MIVDGIKYITEKEVAHLCGRTVAWVRKIRYAGLHFPYYKLNGRVFYIENEVIVWFKDNLRRM